MRSRNLSFPSSELKVGKEEKISHERKRYRMRTLLFTSFPRDFLVGEWIVRLCVRRGSFSQKRGESFQRQRCKDASRGVFCSETRNSQALSRFIVEDHLKNKLSCVTRRLTLSVLIALMWPTKDSNERFKYLWIPLVSRETNGSYGFLMKTDARCLDKTGDFTLFSRLRSTIYHCND